jgi:hypothetical protein
MAFDLFVPLLVTPFVQRRAKTEQPHFPLMTLHLILCKAVIDKKSIRRTTIPPWVNLP